MNVFVSLGIIEEKIFQARPQYCHGLHGGVASGSGLGAPNQYTCTSRKKWEVSFTQEELRDLFSPGKTHSVTHTT